MERLFGAIAKGLDGLVLASKLIADRQNEMSSKIDGLVKGNAQIAKRQDEIANDSAELRRAFADLVKTIVKSGNRTETRLSDLQVAVDAFTSRVEAVVEHQKTLTGVTVDAKRELEESTEALTVATKDLTGKIKTLSADDETAAPKWSHRALDFVWPTAVRHGPAAIRWGVKLVGGIVSLGGIAKIIHMLWNGQ